MKLKKSARSFVLASMFFWVLVSLLIFGMTSRHVTASVPTKLDPNLIRNLKLNSLGERLQFFGQNPKESYRRLHEIAFDRESDLRLRWNALMSMAVLGGDESLPDLERAATSQDWFMRDAALKALSRVAPSSAVKWSRRLLSDPSLVVRTAAVLTIKELRDTESADVLWEKLNSRENFRGRQGLWIRKHIVETLTVLKAKDVVHQLIKVLDDPDRSLQMAAISGLEECTGQRLGLEAESHQNKKAYWKKWVRSHATTSLPSSKIE